MHIKSEDDFISLVKKAEEDADKKPKLYVAKLALFAVLGYVVIFLVLTALLGLAGGLIATAFFSTGLFILLLKKKLLFAVLIGIWVLAKALWVRFPQPQGQVLQRRDYPELFREIDTLRKQLKTLKIHEVLLDREFNAAVVQYPRLGVLGWHKNYLILGYQLLLALSPEEMRSVIAHELGHLSGNHSRFSGWIYRIRLVWLRVMTTFDQVDSWGTGLMRKFFAWYSPQFEAYSFALARRNEFEADAVSAKLTSSRIAADALVNVHVTAPYLSESYWDNYYLQADRYPRPQNAPFEGLSSFLSDAPLGEDQAIARVKQEMDIETHYADTHPSLKDRIQALGMVHRLPERKGISAAEAWLGEGNKQIMESFDKIWLEENSEPWQERYEYVRDAKDQLQRFSHTEPSELTDEELWNYACWTNEFKSREDALPLFETYQTRYPQSPDPAYFIGLIQLSRGNGAGLQQLRLACNNPNLLEAATRSGYSYLLAEGREEEAESWYQESVEQNRIYTIAQQERDNIGMEDTLISPEIDDALLQQLITALQKRKKITKAWLAQKVVQYYPEDPVYIVAFAAKGFSFSSENLQAEVADSLDINGLFFVVSATGEGKALAKKVRKAGRKIV